MNQPTPLNKKLSHGFETFVLIAVQALLVIVILVALADLFLLLWRAVEDGRVREIESIQELQRALQRSIAGVLLVVLALELREALSNYFVEHRVRVEVILSLALIATGRHIIQLDYEHVPGLTLIGVAVLVASLSGGLYFMGAKRSALERERPSP